MPGALSKPTSFMRQVLVCTLVIAQWHPAKLKFTVSCIVAAKFVLGCSGGSGCKRTGSHCSPQVGRKGPSFAVRGKDKGCGLRQLNHPRLAEWHRSETEWSRVLRADLNGQKRGENYSTPFG